MNTIVFVKRVPDTESRIKIDQAAKAIVEERLNFILSPYDEYALEEALRIRETHGGKVTVVSVGTEESLTVLKKCLAMGADEAILLKDEIPETWDGMRIAKIIAHAIENKYSDYNLLLFGKQSVGTDNAQVPSMVAELLGLAQVNVVVKLEIDGNKGIAYREIEGALEKTSFSLPAVVSAQKGLNEPRYETLKGIMSAKRKEIPILSIGDLGLKEEELVPQVEMTRLESPLPRKTGKVIEGEPAETAQKLVEFLHREAKVI
jgi:electron transfer flavoprotein beta subunit